MWAREQTLTGAGSGGIGECCQLRLHTLSHTQIILFLTIILLLLLLLLPLTLLPPLLLLLLIDI